MKTEPTVMVTGAGGYIGGQVGLDLVDRGYRVIGIDRRKRPVSQHWHKTIEAGFTSEDTLRCITRQQPAALVHCAGTSLVGPSVDNPGEYYRNNVARTVKLLEHVRQYSPRTHVIFASSAATYGNPPPELIPLKEDAAGNPISPYGRSKLMVEHILEDYAQAYGIKSTAFRFFNVCGADWLARHGQEDGATHIIARVLESIRDDATFTCYGRDYDTPDGTCIRDYVHVSDIASAVRTAIETGITGAYNIGTNRGVSNLEIVETAQAVTGKKVKLEFGARREGDPNRLLADATRLMTDTNWQPQYCLEDMIAHAWKWYVR